jgi:hypothetical protein
MTSTASAILGELPAFSDGTSALDKVGFQAADGSRAGSTVPEVEGQRGGPGHGPPGAPFPG